MTYAEAIAYLDGFVNYERGMPGRDERTAFDLSRILELAARLGDPQRAFPSVHVAGTKGKGSCCAFAAAILRAAGLKVGLYTSPHLRDLRERIRVNGAPVPEADFARLLDACKPHLETMRALPEGTRRPTYFEALTHLAFMHFAEQRVDVAVVEVGLGGRLDATNIVEPAACGITRISRDHMAILGDTLALIAREKAGILKSKVHAVSAPQHPEAAAAIEAAARKAGAPLEFIGKGTRLELEPRDPPPGKALPHLDATLVFLDGHDAATGELGLPGVFQAENWAVAVRLAQIAFRRLRGSALPERAVAKGSREVDWPGRLEELPRKTGEPLVILDGAHNDDSVEKVLKELRALLPDTAPRVALFACAKDKDVPSILKILAKGVDDAVFTHSGNPRGVEPAELAAQWKAAGGATSKEAPAVIRELAPAFQEAKQRAGEGGVVLCTGSLYLVGALKDLLAQN